ncbi:MAG: hypothetical protein FJ050_01840 [Cyanobacteria bacterium M_surface_7_m2_040]|nr:hypothetical protein [Cyanobacteria bacterium M_surface_9_m1_291]MBM5826790.1 hypothetical protein [Cyanobacteria bacterium M_surface_7_m2_040]
MPSSWAAAPPSPRPQASLQQLDEACQAARQRGALQSLRLLQRNLLQVSPAPQPLPVVLANADALLRCGAPDGALVVLNRYSPAAGAEQIQWSMLQWRAAAAALDHRLAAEALRQLALASGRSLEALQVPVGQDAKGRWQNQIALDLLAGHLDALGQRQQAAQLLLSSRTPGVVSAQRLAQAVAWAGATMPLEERQRWLEKALDQAAAAGAWGLAAALLDQQLALFEQPSPQRLKLEERRRRLGRRLDDSQAVNPAAVRSPRDPGGHAAAPQP